MASVSAANLSTKAKIDVSSLPAFSEEVISSKNPRCWNDLPEHILLKIFDSLAKDDDNGRAWVSRAGRVCKAWLQVSKDLLLGDTAASRPKRAQMIASEVHDNKTTLATKGDLVEESVNNSASEVEACSKRQRLDSSSQQLLFSPAPALSDERSLRTTREEITAEVGSLVSHLVVNEAQNETAIPAPAAAHAAATNAHAMSPPPPEFSGQEVEEGPCPSSNDRACGHPSTYLGPGPRVNFNLTHVNSIVKNCLGSPIMQTTSVSTET
mmetsp:Transcript_3703/g.8451  ORF Transcript_3703/g.8451 Transcript_3703/m.8451 type:complete len:267 (+) Transcript_3703:184-984(+)